MGAVSLTTGQRSSGGYVAHIDISTGADVRRGNEAALLRGEQALADAQRIAHLGSRELDLAANRMLWSEELYRCTATRRLPPRAWPTS